MIKKKLSAHLIQEVLEVHLHVALLASALIPQRVDEVGGRTPTHIATRKRHRQHHHRVSVLLHHQLPLRRLQREPSRWAHRTRSHLSEI